MPDPASIVVLLLSVGAAFFLSRFIASKWREWQRDKNDKAERDAESRQVRRARERRGRG